MGERFLWSASKLWSMRRAGSIPQTHAKRLNNLMEIGWKKCVYNGPLIEFNVKYEAIWHDSRFFVIFILCLRKLHFNQNRTKKKDNKVKVHLAGVTKDIHGPLIACPWHRRSRVIGNKHFLNWHMLHWKFVQFHKKSICICNSKGVINL